MRTRRIVSFVLSALLVLSCLSVAALSSSAASALTLKADKSKASIGEIVTVSVGVPSGLSGIAFGVGFDSSYLSVVSAKPTNLIGNAQVSVNEGRIGYAAAMNKAADAGIALTITFKVLKMGATVKATVKEALDIDDREVSVSGATLTIKAGDKTINFPDVHENDWFYEAVEYCAEKGYITGYNTGYFGPADSIKRQDFVLIFSRIDGADLSSYKNKTGGFKDVAAGSYYAPAVAWGAEKGIITGYNADKFGVGDTITREQVCAIVYRYMNSPEISDADSILSAFADKGSISAYAYDAVAWCVANGVISGKNPTTVAPREGASRAQIATIIMRMDKAGMFAE